MTETRIVIDGTALVIPPYAGPAPILTKLLIESTGVQHTTAVNIIDNISFFQTPQAIADARSVTLPACGHAMMAERPDLVLGALKGFLPAVSAASPSA